MVTLCETAPEVAVMVTCDIVGVGVGAMDAADCPEEHPESVPAATSRSASSDPRTRPDRIDLRFRPANVSSPTGPINARVTPAGEWNRWIGWLAEERT